uniref:Peptidase S1 domain-containing protein n=1 Tax=Varanus komodoensis TaxID=61221 RepID=A0A8D2KZR8_VARKO
QFLLQHSSCYDRSTFNNDIMLLKLRRPVSISPTVAPLGLPSACSAPGTTCIVSGWGTSAGLFFTVTYPDVLQCGNVRIISQEQCTASYPQYITGNMVCAGVPEGGVDTCQGLPFHPGSLHFDCL